MKNILNFKIKKILPFLLIFAFFFSFFYLTNLKDSSALSGTGCTDQVAGLMRYERCRVNQNDSMDILAEGCSPSCMNVANVCDDVFIPVKTCDEWLSFFYFSPTGCITFSECTPSAPSGVGCSSISQTQINISWNSVNDFRGVADGYKIYRCTGSGCTPTNQVHNTSNTSWADSGLSSDTTYRYRVKAYNSGGDSEYSSTVTCATYPDPPSAPTGVSCETMSISEINVSWNSSSGAYGYLVYRCAGSGCTPINQVQDTSNTFWLNGGLNSGTTYRYRVKSYGEGGESGYSSTVTCTTQSDDPSNDDPPNDDPPNDDPPNDDPQISWSFAFMGNESFHWTSTGSLDGAWYRHQMNIHPDHGTDWSGMVQRNFASMANQVYSIRCITSGTCSGSSIVHGGQTYAIQTIGNNCWMAENLNYSGHTSGKSVCYDENSSNCNTYGRLYDWEAAQGSCPSGWSLPSDANWKVLESVLGMPSGCSCTNCDCNSYPGSGEGWYDDEGPRWGGDVGTQLKTSTWGGNNSSGLSFLPGGQGWWSSY